MLYSFQILGVSPILQFFNHQQEVLYHKPQTGVEYLGSYKCTLDALIESIETVSPNHDWNLDQALETVIDYWMHNVDRIDYWKRRLRDAGAENLIVSRLANFKALQAELDLLFDR